MRSLMHNKNWLSTEGSILPLLQVHILLLLVNQ